MPNRNMTVHMGAGQWIVTVHGRDGDTVFDLNAMTPAERGRFFGEFRRVINRHFGRR